MIFTTSNRQGFGKTLSGIPGTAIESVYAKPIVDDSNFAENASVWGPLGNPWNWRIYPWNWGKQEKVEDMGVAEESPTSESVGNNILMFAAVVGAIWLFFKRG